MPRGLPDYISLDAQTSVMEQTDINLPAYLTGFARLDGGGRVIYFNDFREGILGLDAQGVAGADVPVVTWHEDWALGSSGSVMLNPVVQNGQAFVSSTAFATLSGKLGIEIGFRIMGFNPHLYFSFGFTTTTGSDHYGILGIESATGNITVHTGGGSQTIVTVGDPSKIAIGNSAVKMIIDPVADIYKYLYWQGVKIPIDLPMSGGWMQGLPGFCYWRFHVVGGAAPYVLPAYIHYVCLTADEP